MLKKHGGARKGAGRPRRESPLGYLRVLDDPQASEQDKSSAAQGLARCSWSRTERQRFLKTTRADYVALHVQTVDRLWEALLIGLPKMAEQGDVGKAWFAYQMMARERYGSIKPRPEVLAKVREMIPYQGARALWRISLADDPKGPYKSTEFLRIRRKARTALCKGIGIPITKELIKVPGHEFAGLLLRTMIRIRPFLSPEQAVVLAAWGDSERGMSFLKKVVEMGLFRPGWWPARPQGSVRTTRRK